ncbi:N,N-dimethylformamidase beta subunit family domain-containing protein [Shinella sp. M27]|uniref:N,N-dimethylformamidase beta subunit family domain-containing protein n=1 Tax=Shinella sp. M27 TaxID=3368614 RepID=UPI003BA34541
MTTEGKGPAITPRTRARARHILDHYYIGPSRDAAVLEIWGYTPRMTYAPGEEVVLHVSTTAERWSYEVGRDGSRYEPVLAVENLPGHHHDTPADCSVTGCGWPESARFIVPTDWRPGGYLITFIAERDGDWVEEHHLILVRRAPDLPRAPYLLVCATGTWLAYNCWGGSNHYEGITGPEGNAFSPVLSTQRPWTRGFCKLPAGAPRALPEGPQRPDDMVRYPYMEWAYAYGYSKKYASAGWASYERLFARWAESAGYDLDFATLHDLDADPGLLDGHSCVIFVGHDEYWSAAMRDAVDAFVAGGGKVARFAGNFLWQTRLEDEGRRQICYKYLAEDDPLSGTEQAHLVTGAWEVAPVDRPGALTFGVNALRGIYTGLGRCVGLGSGGFTVYRSGHWAFAGAGLGYGDQLGAASRVFGYEVDGLDYRMDDGLPFPTGTDGGSLDITILAMGLATNIETDNRIWGETQYIGASDAAFKAQSLYGAVTPETVDASARGNGMIVHWAKERGEIFTAATCEWVVGLARGDMQVHTVTRNVLDRFGGR